MAQNTVLDMETYDRNHIWKWESKWLEWSVPVLYGHTSNVRLRIIESLPHTNKETGCSHSFWQKNS